MSSFGREGKRIKALDKGVDSRARVEQLEVPDVATLERFLRAYEYDAKVASYRLRRWQSALFRTHSARCRRLHRVKLTPLFPRL
jgi:hypothetical protein